MNERSVAARRLRLALALLAAAVSAGPSSLPAQEAPSLRLRSEIDVRVYNVEVGVTDRSGRPVGGLTAGDFQLRVDGRELPIQYFAAIDDRGSPAGEAPAAPPSGDHSAPRSYLVFIDNSLAIAPYRNALLRDIASQLDALGDDDRMAIVEFDGARVRPLTPWTADRVALRGALAEACTRSSLGVLRLAQERSVESDVDFMQQAAGENDAVGTGALDATGARGKDFLRDAAHDDVRDVAHLRQASDVLLGARSPEVNSALRHVGPALGATLREHAAAPGRRVLLLISADWAIPTGEVEEAVAVANQVGFTMYPLDASTHDPALLRVADAWAKQTGGRAVAAGLRRTAFEQVAADAAVYYSIGFEAPWEDADRVHAVEVRLRDSRLRVRHRGGVWTASRVTTARQAALGLLYVEGTSPRRRLQVEVGPLAVLDRKLATVTVTVRVPFDLLEFHAVDGVSVADLLLSAAIEDDKGRQRIGPAMRERVERGPGSSDAATLRFDLKVRRAPQRVVFVASGVLGGEAWGDARIAP